MEDESFLVTSNPADPTAGLLNFWLWPKKSMEADGPDGRLMVSPGNDPNK